MLKDMAAVFHDFGVDYYLVGAVAMDIHLSADLASESIRKTEDVDLAIQINDEGQYNELKKALIATGHFAAHPTEAIKLFYNNQIEVDLLPFGKIEEPNRDVRLSHPSFVLNMPGFKEIYPFVEDMQINDDLIIKVCKMEGIILLKLISNNDRPQRTKDITDIEHIIRVYFDLYANEIYENHFDAMDLYDTAQADYLQVVCARVIGRKIRDLLIGSGELMERIKNILMKRPTASWLAMFDGIDDLG
jgi:predicted nucleotidyltransferase